MVLVWFVDLDQYHQRTFSNILVLFMFETYRLGFFPAHHGFFGLNFFEKWRVLQKKRKDEFD